MFPVPITFYYDFKTLDAGQRQCVMAEFAANGAKHLVLTHDLINMIMADITMADTLNKEMSNARLSFVDAHAPFGQFMDLNCPEEPFRSQLLMRHKLHLKIAADMGVNTLTIHVGNDYYYPHLPLDKHIALMAEALDEILPVAEDNRITVCIENIWCRSNTPEVLLELKRRFPTDILGFCFDAGHANQMDKGRLYERNSAYDSYILVDARPEYDDRIQEKMLPYTVNCHLHDNDGQYDTHINIGDGNTDWQKVVSLLEKTPHLKCIQSEVVPLRNRIPVKDICQAFHRLFNHQQPTTMI